MRLDTLVHRSARPYWRTSTQPRSRTFLPLKKIMGWVGLAILVCLLLTALFPQAIAPYDPHVQVGRPLERPGIKFWLGTNDIGQDLLSELLWATRVSLTTGLIAAFLAVSAGIVVGTISGYTHGVLSEVLLRLIDLTLVLPFLPFVILLSAYLGPGQRNVILVLALVYWAVPARVIRSHVLSMDHKPFIEAARALGSSSTRIMFVHIWPGVRQLALVQFTLIASASILAEASLSFLGLGDPAAKSWGAMLYFARSSGAFLNDAWRWWVFPAGLMITLTVLSLVLIGFSLERTFSDSQRI